MALVDEGNLYTSGCPRDGYRFVGLAYLYVSCEIGFQRHPSYLERDYLSWATQGESVPYPEECLSAQVPKICSVREGITDGAKSC